MLSSNLFPQFLLLVGLNFINGMAGAVATEPPFRFADKVDSIPAGEFYDILKVGNDYWLAGESLTRLHGASNPVQIRDGRHTALVYDAAHRRIWYSGPEEIGYINEADSLGRGFPSDAGYIWELIRKDGRLWYFGSTGYGFFDLDNPSIHKQFEFEFVPRPVVSDPGPGSGQIFVGAAEGLYSISIDGHRLVLPVEKTGGMMTIWAHAVDETIICGTRESVYHWSGNPEDEPVQIPSQYGKYFQRGISNSIRVGRFIAITNFPDGVVFWDLESQSVDSLCAKLSGLDIGDVYKIRPESDESLLVLGMKGVATVELSEDARFFKGIDLFPGGSIRGTMLHDGFVNILTDEDIVRVSPVGYCYFSMERPSYWMEISPDGSLVTGAVDEYKTLGSKGDFHVQYMSDPVYRVHWSDQWGVATGQDGLYEIDAGLNLELVYPSKHKLEILGELDGELYVLGEEGEIIRLGKQADGWSSSPFEGRVPGELIKSAPGQRFIFILTSEGFLAFDGQEFRSFTFEEPWTVKSFGACGGEAVLALFNPTSGEWAIASISEEASRMVHVPHLEKLGVPVDILCDDNNLVVVGTAGVGWYLSVDLALVGAPQVSFDLLFEDQHIADRVIPPGMHFIDLRVNFSGPQVPCVVQYRINGERWRNVNLQDPSLQFAGHGSFTVELRAVHPNGNASPTKLVQFGIAPPWYLNPLYQVLMLVLAMLLAGRGSEEGNARSGSLQGGPYQLPRRAFARHPQPAQRGAHDRRDPDPQAAHLNGGSAPEGPDRVRHYRRPHARGDPGLFGH